MSDLAPNLLAVIFGRVLRQLRVGQSKSSRELARSLRISFSAYRLIEAGSAIFNPIHTPELIEVFDGLSWPRLLAFITCAQRSGWAGRVGKDYWGAARLISSLDADLSVLIGDMLRGLTEATETAKEGPDGGPIPAQCVEAARRFLEGKSYLQSINRSESGSAKTLSTWASQAPDALSPIQLDMVLQEIETLQHFPPNVPPKQIALWEAGNSAAFKNVHAFIGDLIATNQIADQFHWDYLFLADFEQVRILTPKFNGFAQAKQDFLRHIARIKGGVEKWLRRVSKKVQIMQIEGDRLEELNRRLLYDAWEGRLSRETDDVAQAIPLKNIWLYQLQRNDITVGFVDSWTLPENLASTTSKRELSKTLPENFVSATLSKGDVSMLLPYLTSPWAK